MKMMPEREDLEEVRRVARLHCGVLLYVVDARRLLQSPHAVQVVTELFLCGGSLADTASREYLQGAIVDVVFDGADPPRHVDRALGYEKPEWHWPCFGSSPAYAKEFWQRFPRAVRDFGWRMVAEEEVEK